MTDFRIVTDNKAPVDEAYNEIIQGNVSKENIMEILKQRAIQKEIEKQMDYYDQGIMLSKMPSQEQINSRKKYREKVEQNVKQNADRYLKEHYNLGDWADEVETDTKPDVNFDTSIYPEDVDTGLLGNAENFYVNFKQQYPDVSISENEQAIKDNIKNNIPDITNEDLNKMYNYLVSQELGEFQPIEQDEGFNLFDLSFDDIQSIFQSNYQPEENPEEVDLFNVGNSL